MFNELTLIVLLGFLGNASLVTEILLVEGDCRSVLLDIFPKAIDLGLKNLLLVLEFAGLLNFPLLVLGEFLVRGCEAGNSGFKFLLEVLDLGLEYRLVCFRQEGYWNILPRVQLPAVPCFLCRHRGTHS